MAAGGKEIEEAKKIQGPRKRKRIDKTQWAQSEEAESYSESDEISDIKQLRRVPSQKKKLNATIPSHWSTVKSFEPDIRFQLS